MAGAAAQPALANWQFTQWGWNEDQVRSACPAACTVGDGDGFTGHHLTMPYTTGRYSFTAPLFFDDGKLSHVVVYDAKEDDAVVLLNSLREKYGAPMDAQTRPIIGTEVKWFGADDLVEYYYSPMVHVLNVSYRPRVNQNTRRL